MIEFDIPDLTQGSDQSAMLTISNTVTLGFLAKNSSGHFVMRVPGDLRTADLENAEGSARDRFFELLGILRAKKYGRGELVAEVIRSPARDDSGSVTVRVGTIKEYDGFPGDLENFARKAAHRMAESVEFRDALRLFGGPNRDGAVYYKIYEFAKKALGGPDAIKKILGLSKRRQREFTKSANNLAATEGGRHANNDPSKVSMTLDGLSAFTTDLMSAWITYAPV